MAIDGLILLDNTGRPIIQSGFRSNSPAYPLIHVDAFNHALSKAAASQQNLDPVISVPPHQSADASSACCHVSCGDMRILCPISGDVDPLVAFAFLQTFVDILVDYFVTVNIGTMKEHFDVVYQLLEETLDSGGHPLTTSPNALRDIVLPPSLLTKLLNAAGANINAALNPGSGPGSAAGPFSSPISWRKAGVRYAANEIYFDVVEEYKSVVNKHGIAMNSSVWGKIETNARLSGTPDCLLSFSNSHVITDCAFHQCVRLLRWTRDKRISFIPPDGRFILMEYRFSPASTPTTTARLNQNAAPATNTPHVALANTSKDNVPLPFSVKTFFELEDLNATFDITLTSRLTTRAIENLVGHINLGHEAGGIKCIASRGAGGFGRALGMDPGFSLNSGASWSFDPAKKMLRWEISSIPPSSAWNLRGSFTTSKSPPRPSHAMQFLFEIQSHTFSSLKVEQLLVTGETYKPYKGVRGRSTGNIEWRW